MTIKAHYDGKVLVPDEPLDLQKDQQVELIIQPLPVEEKKYMTGAELASGPWVGAWADRDDIKDPVDFVNEIRRKIERREL